MFIRQEAFMNSMRKDMGMVMPMYVMRYAENEEKLPVDTVCTGISR